jgi:uncharacterized protein (TIGR03118 family)
MQRKPRRMFPRLLLVGVTVGALMAPAFTSAQASSSNSFKVRRLVTDTTGGKTVDPALVNPWGMAQSPTSPVWVSDNGTDSATIYTADADPKVPLTVSIPGGAPTGQVFNGGSGFPVYGSHGTQPAVFIFDSEAGVLSGWYGGTAAVEARTVPDAIFKGLAIATTAGGTFLYAADFHGGRVMMFDDNWVDVTPAGAFTDPNLPAHYAPFGIAALNGKLFVSYAKQDADGEDDVQGPALGFVDVFTTGGAFVKRLVSRGALNAPWGMVIAPAGFGRFGGDLLVGNFGDGRINAYDATSGAYQGTLENQADRDIVLEGLWGLLFGNGTSAPTNALMFTSAPDDEAHGRWGTITPT